MKYFFHPDAEAEHFAEVAFYESRRKGLGARYLASFGAAMERVCRDPKRFRIECEPDLRRAPVRGFPFAVIYRDVNRRTGPRSSAPQASPWVLGREDLIDRFRRN